MKRTILILPMIFLLLTACGLGKTPVPTPEHDNLQTVVAETIAAQPTWTPLPTKTLVPTQVPQTPRPSSTPVPTSIPSATVPPTPGLAVTPVTGSLLPGMPIEGIGCFPVNAPQDLAVVLRVDSGDTISVMLNGEVKVVHYIGIQAPSLKVKPPARMANEAFQKNKALVDGKVVVLIKDSSEKDASGALLRYVVSTDGIFVNYNLVRNGFAISLKTPPDVACQQTFDDAQTRARGANLGLWQPTPTLPPQVMTATPFVPTSVQ